MSELRTAKAVLRSTMKGPAWFGLSVMEVLDGITAEAASERPIRNGHTIWELVLHMTAWYEFTIDALAGKAVEDLPEEKDWPKNASSTPEAWEAAVVRLTERAQQLVTALDSFPEDRLSENVTGKEYPYKVLLHGMALHDAYHLGQISLLKKAQQSGREFYPIEEERG